MRKIAGLNVIVTGANGGIGSCVCRKLADRGANLALASNDADALASLADELSARTEIISGVVDVSSEADIESFTRRAVERFGAPDCLLNLAGLSIPTKIAELNVADYELMLDVNLKGSLLMSKYFARAVDSERGGLIVNIGSMAAKRANANAPLYCTAKAAVNMLSAGMQQQFKEQNIRVTTLNPGGADTPFWGNRPVNRAKLLRPDDIADVIVFVLECDSRIAFSELNFESFLSL
ncbi:MAG TPA: SDR family oxidoreductase [Firmicutes bacterium]|nr:SDR family oxidoreductase [Bacillota bacterium]